ncbi:hypothetical protein [Hymenobacter properus]|uniref:Uncharacterized protein n=1 Tax=Hymenobacter properus TaxID=2791026 RepID=A0A931BCP6_9BACT|nr:hypothetical protein [Hymenobacter properus]MBF9140869.1 hypothetical protein [Hymenobacter properus]MBR7719678.1 hypothetical protein [Microvirga sp. SRT04]
MIPYGQFGYDVGNLVQLRWPGPVYVVRWRGWVMTRLPNGMNHRMAVYWLGPPHWDCYFEDELRPIGHPG